MDIYPRLSITLLGLYVKCWGMMYLKHAKILDLELFLYLFLKHQYLGMTINLVPVAILFNYMNVKYVYGNAQIF